jgi:predicted nucleotide-binding protein
MRLGHLEGLLARMARDQAVRKSVIASPTFEPTGRTTSRKVFVVHGHDNELKEMTARFLEKLELEPIILHEQPSAGRTIIEKFETYSDDVAFAVVLLTPDDVGGIAVDRSDLRARARQNVILELGYFLGRLGRARVCALYKPGVELPSDYQGIIYVDLDPGGAWRTKLAQELIGAKLTFNLSGLL